MRLFLLLLPALLGLAARGEITLQERVTPLPFSHQGPFVRTADGAIWGVNEAGAIVSRDEGRTWETRVIFDASRFQPSKERALLRTKEGVLLYAFLNRKEMVFKWDDNQGGPQADCRIPVYVSRSADDGRTWAAPVLLQNGWCGAVRQFIQLKSGRVLLVCQRAAAHPGRHVTINYLSDDLGDSWRPSQVIDLGGAGNYADAGGGIRGSTHGGGLEGTVLEKAGGELKLLLRVPHGYFHELVSRDGGERWVASQPSPIEASDSPGMLVRLASGRVALLWNRFRDPGRRLGRREELSLAFSTNEGMTWTPPQVIARNPVPEGKRESAYWISYPYAFEARPGRLWISTMQGGLSVALDERDFIGPVEKPIDGATVRIMTLGDSITRGARPGVNPTQIFAARLQAALREAGLPALVHNVGIGGERTDQALARLEADVIAQRPDIVTVMYGTNDSWVDQGKTASRLSEQDYTANLREIVRRLRAAQIRVVLMTEPKFGEQNQRNGVNEEANVRLSRYVEHGRAVARELQVPLVDHFGGWDAEQRRGRVLQALTTDGCHPNPEGHADLAARMVPVVAAVAGELRK